MQTRLFSKDSIKRRNYFLKEETMKKNPKKKEEDLYLN